MKFIKRESNFFDRPIPPAVRDPFVYQLKETADLIRDYLGANPDCNIWVVGDYDSDGINATAIAHWTFVALGKTPHLRLPKRFSEGYGLSEKIIDEITDGLLITVDNGIAAYNAVKKAKEKGLCVVVTDHHLPPVDAEGNYIVPPADIILDPHLYPERSEFVDYCGAALMYRVAQKLLPNKDLKPLMVLASIATVTDVMPLVGANHTLVRDGLELINQRKVVPGLDMLLKRLKADDHINEGDFGFKIGPIFNASGRLRDDGASDVLKLLTNKRGNIRLPYQADALIKTNEQRKQLVKESMELAMCGLTDVRPIVIYNETFQEGIIGIIAGQLCERFHCPAIVFTKSEKEGVLKGSGRSIPEIHLKNILDSIQDKILGYGGHAGAAGLSIELANLDAFTQAFQAATPELPELNSDIAYFDEDLDVSNIEQQMERIMAYAPYGEANPQPVFHMQYHAKNKYKAIGDGTHFMIKDPDITLIGFGLTETYEKMGSPSDIECVGYLSESWFNGKKSYKFEIIAFDKS